MKAKYIVILLALLVGVWGILKLMGNREKFEMAAEEKNEVPIRYVKTMKAKPGDNTIIVEGQGKISSSQKVDISSEVQGLLINSGKRIKPGVTFKQGEILYSIKNTDARLALQARKSNFLSIVAGALPDLKLDFASNYENWKNFYDLIYVNEPLPDLPKVMSQKEKTFISLKNIYTEYFNIKADEEKLNKYRITAPFNGSITEVFVEPGSIINPGSRIASIIRTGDLEIDIPVDVHNISYIKIGADVKLTSTTNNKSFEGTVVRIGEFVNASTQSIPVYIKINKKEDDVLYNGMYLVAEINCGVIPNSIKIPRRALPDQEHYYSLKPTKKKIKEESIDAFTIQKNPLKTAFVLKNNIIAIDIEGGTEIVSEPLTQFSKETLFRPITDSKK